MIAICKLCGEPWDKIKNHQYCPKCREELELDKGKVCRRCGAWFTPHGKQQICNDCKHKRQPTYMFGKSLDEYSPAELLNYGKVKANEYIEKERKMKYEN